MVRQFRLVGLKQAGIDNEEYVDLNDFNKYLLTTPTDLGFEFTNTYVETTSERLRVKQEIKYNKFTATIEVCGATRNAWEENYNRLRDFITANKDSGFKLYYRNTSNNERYIVCDIQKFSKTEKNSYCIPVNIEVEPKSLWSVDASSSIEFADETLEDYNMLEFKLDEGFTETDEFRYNYGYKYDANLQDYNVGFAGDSSYGADIFNYSDVNIPLIITLYGECLNPFITLIDENDNVLQSCKVNIELEENETLIINSSPNDLRITYTTASGSTYNVTNNRDLSLYSFFSVPVGTYKLRIQDDNNSLIKGNIKYSYAYMGA